jgi:membrane protease YdiL (CAAX protease family)
MEVTVPDDKLGIALRLGLYVFLAVAGMLFFPVLLYWSGTGVLITSVLGTFGAAALANAIVIRVFERRGLADIGLGWPPGSARNLLIGLVAGIAAALLVLLPPLIARAAVMERDPAQASGWPSLLFITILLIFGAVSEEMLFHGYAFQLLVSKFGVYATILPVSILFAIAHSRNANLSWLGLINTFGFGIVLGYAMVRTGDLWTAIGIHFGWNWMLPLFGVNLSGFTMGVTGFSMRWSVGDLWSGGQYGPEGSLLTCGVIVVLLVYLHKAPVQKQETFLLQARQEA